MPLWVSRWIRLHLTKVLFLGCLIAAFVFPLTGRQGIVDMGWALVFLVLLAVTIVVATLLSRLLWRPNFCMVSIL